MSGKTHEDEFTEMVNSRWPTLVRAAILLGCRPAEAEDVVQAALTRCYQSWRQVRRAESPDSYVHRVLVNTFIDRTRRRSYGELPVAEPRRADAGVTSTDVDLRLDLDAALRALSEAQRVVVVLRYYLDLSERETANALGVPAGTVKSRLARGLAALAIELGPDAGEAGGLS
jgi:RNA polymerase sigma-70 factor (sigma-E family)